jgi:hypothetical protein
LELVIDRDDIFTILVAEIKSVLECIRFVDVEAIITTGADSAYIDVVVVIILVANDGACVRLFVHVLDLSSPDL